MQNVSNAGLGTGLHASEVSHVSTTTGEITATTHGQKVRKNSTFGKANGEFKFSSRDSGEAKTRAHQGGSLAGKSADRNSERQNRGPARGGQMGSALSVALASKGLSAASYPAAPAPAPGKPARQFNDKKFLQSKARGPKTSFSGKNTSGHRVSVNRGK